ncbi:quinol monooxygenase YgiN [Rhizobium mesoamericanum]|uniref:hypothetical protein n=1 Tax=Rhizobium mesoamericanum TaxID=1079800 RepID=UPI00278AF810|nr:hypothetical protein [Rhizobium mesoamericanum]MDQ0561234.1 quinol monooxygenase YgiN [Rhizobium mesoamericanum]
MSTLAVIGIIEAVAGHREQLITLLEEHRARCLRDESGTPGFNILKSNDDETKTLQEAEWVERANGDQFEAHHLCSPQWELFEHFVSDGRCGDIHDERDPRLTFSEYHSSILPSR